MKLTPDEFKNLPTAIQRRNPDLFMDAVESQKQKPDARTTLVSNPQIPKASRGRMATGGPVLRVTIIGCEARRRDSDNPEYKFLRDAIARDFNLDDEDGTIIWEYGKIETRGEQGTIVKITET